MSDYMFMLESHLSPDQNRVMQQVRVVAAESGVNVFLTGGALRDMVAGFPISDIDFTVEGNGLKVARAVAAKTGADLTGADETNKSAELTFPGSVRVKLGMAKQERYAKPGAKPQISPASIHEDLRGRDFTINSIALSLSPASRGLLLDPNNGVGDIERKELRAVTNYTLYDDPVRLLRLLRFKVRLGYSVVERTWSQYTNAREAGLESKISPAALLNELHHIASEQNVADLVMLLDQEKLLGLLSPALTGAKLNLTGLQKLQKARHLIPHGVDLRLNHLGLFLAVLAEKLSAEEKARLVAATGLPPELVEEWQKLDARAKKLERELKSAKLTRPSRVYSAAVKAPGDQLLYLLLKSPERLVQDRIRNYLQKYLPMAQEVTSEEVSATGVLPGTPKFEKARAQLIAVRLDARPKKVPPPPEPEPPAPPPVPMHAFARKSIG